MNKKTKHVGMDPSSWILNISTVVGYSWTTETRPVLDKPPTTSLGTTWSTNVQSWIIQGNHLQEEWEDCLNPKFYQFLSLCVCGFKKRYQKESQKLSYLADPCRSIFGNPMIFSHICPPLMVHPSQNVGVQTYCILVPVFFQTCLNSWHGIQQGLPGPNEKWCSSNKNERLFKLVLEVFHPFFKTFQKQIAS